jgi:hypothetical protein
MARFVEFLKSGMDAKEFIDTAVLPQHVIPVERTGLSPKPYEPEEEGANTGVTDAVLDAAAGNPPEPPAEEDKAADMEGGTGQELIEGGDDIDPGFLAELEAAEREGTEP